MKKIFLTLAIIASSMAAFAQTNATSDNSKACTEQNCGADKKCDKDRNCSKAFEGITLTADQQSKLAALRDNFQKERQQKAEAIKDKKADGNKQDLTKEQRMQMKKEHQAAANERRQKYLADVKEILTPDQYVKFLENNFVFSSKQGHGPKKDMVKGHSGKKNFNGDKKGHGPKGGHAKKGNHGNNA